jgi:hypothetical protein
MISTIQYHRAGPAAPVAVAPTIQLSQLAQIRFSNIQVSVYDQLTEDELGEYTLELWSQD